MQSELKPCAHCGGEAELRGFQPPEFWVACPRVGCKANTEGFDSKERAIAAWNARASDAEITRLTEALRAAEEREKGLREDVKRFEIEEVIAHCEGCSAPLLSNDDFVSDDDCVYGCWAAMTDAQPHRERPCYAYRVGKPAARQALAGAKT